MQRRIAPAAVLVTLAATLVVGVPNGPAAAVDGPSLSVDPASGRHPISPDIYGMNFTDEALATELKLPLRRWGGNATTRYNYLYDTDNRASDWFFENITEDNANPAALPDGSSTDRFVEQDRRTGAKTILTLPLIGWAPKARDGSCGFSVAKYGPQQSTDQWRPDCGNGVKADGTNVTGNDPHDTSVEIGPDYIKGWVSHLTGRYGTAANGGVAYYDLDNEPDLWHSTHRDVHPLGASSVELRDQAISVASALKSVDPGAKTLGPVGWGWTSWTHSGLDEETCSRLGGSCWSNPPDAGVRAGLPFTTWYLQQLAAYEKAHGTRLLDYFDMHFYPQNGAFWSGGGDPATNALRLRSTRSLWDPTYTDESWIGTQVQLVPRMKQAVNDNYPGTKTAITEYNWGALDSLNGALTQADILGIFGREGLDLATLWAPPSATQPGAYAFRAFLNYDGAGAKFGDAGVSATSTDQEKLAVYAAQRSNDKATTLVIVNKSTDDLTSPLTIAGRTDTTLAKTYRYSAANLNAITKLADQTVTAGALTSTYPANSITVLEIPPAPVTPTVALKAQYSNSDTNATNAMIKPTLAVVSTGTARVPLSRVTLRYWFTKDTGTTKVNASCLTAATGCTKLTQKVVTLPTPRAGADRYLEVGFTAAAGALTRGNSTTGQLSFKLTKPDKSAFTETDDYSYQPYYGRWKDAALVTAYLDGTLIWGTEPQ